MVIDGVEIRLEKSKVLGMCEELTLEHVWYNSNVFFSKTFVHNFTN